MEKTEKITIRFTEQQKIKILARAMELNMRMAEYIRYVVVQDLEKKNVSK